MPKPPERPRRPQDPWKAAEAVFRREAPKPVESPPQGPAVPNAKDTVTLRIDREILAYFQEEGPGWQDRINAALRKLVKG